MRERERKRERERETERQRERETERDTGVHDLPYSYVCGHACLNSKPACTNATSILLL